MGNKQAEVRIEVHNLFKVTSLAEFQTKVQRIVNMDTTLEDIYENVAAP